MIGRCLRLMRGCALLAAAAVLATAAPSGAVLLDHEYISAYTQLGRLRMLTQRISKQNLLYQLHLADQHKLGLLETVNTMNEALEMLRIGGPLVGVPRPPTAEIGAQLDVIAMAWAPLETMALASPYEYLRRSREFITPRNRRGAFEARDENDWDRKASGMRPLAQQPGRKLTSAIPTARRSHGPVQGYERPSRNSPPSMPRSIITSIRSVI